MTEKHRPILNPNARNSWKLKIYSLLTAPFRKTIPAFITTTCIYLAAYNIGVRYWKGPNHPINRFNWRLQENNNQLDPILKLKKEKVLNYYTARIYHPSDSAPTFGL